ALERRTIRSLLGGTAVITPSGACGCRATLECRATTALVSRSIHGVDRNQTRLDTGELRRADLILLLIREAGDQIAHLFDAITRHRMSAERLSYRARLLFLLGLELFKKGDHRVRAVPRAPHILIAEPIPFFPSPP